MGKLKERKGFVLIDVIIGILILSVAAVSIHISLSAGLRAVITQREAVREIMTPQEDENSLEFVF